MLRGARQKQLTAEKTFNRVGFAFGLLGEDGRVNLGHRERVLLKRRRIRFPSGSMKIRHAWRKSQCDADQSFRGCPEKPFVNDVSPSLLSPKICKTDRIKLSRLITGILFAAERFRRFVTTVIRLVWRTVCLQGNDEELGRKIRQVDSFAVNRILNTRWTWWCESGYFPFFNASLFRIDQPPDVFGRLRQ